MQIRNNSTTNTIDTFISTSIENSIQFQNSSYYQLVDSEIMEDFNIFRDRYYGQIMSYTELLALSNEEYLMYKYRPKRLSAKLYNTIDYWYILLLINKMSSILQFKKKTIRVITLEGVRFIKYIMQKEEKEIAENKLKINTELKLIS